MFGSHFMVLYMVLYIIIIFLFTTKGERKFHIRHLSSNLYLDGREYKVHLHHYDITVLHSLQLWTIESAGKGKYFFTNVGSDFVLDASDGGHNNSVIRTFGRHGGLNQQWYYNNDFTIVSAADIRFAINIGNGVRLAPINGGDRQRFIIEEDVPTVTSEESKKVIITNPYADCVLDGSLGEKVMLHPCSKSPAQIWIIESSEYGTYFIKNSATGLVLEAEGECHKYSRIVAREKHGGRHQHWLIDYKYGHITCADDTRFVIDVPYIKHPKCSYYRLFIYIHSYGEEELLLYPKDFTHTQSFVIKMHDNNEEEEYLIV